jgi:acid phosphatase
MQKRPAAVWVVALLMVGGVVYGVSTSAASVTSTGAAQGNRGACRAKHKTCPPTPTPTSPTPTTSRSTTAPPPAGGHKVMVIIEENHSRTEAIATMLHLAAWATRYGQATNYTATTHPSLPNYLAIGGGSTFGVTDDNPPSSHPISGASVFGQTRAVGKTAKVYAESMPANCALTSSGNYAVKHNEWAYFSDATERTGCTANDVPMGTTSGGNLLNDINAGRLPITGQMTPNLCNDAHDCSLATADTWLAGWVPKLIGGPDYTSGHLTIVITFDEDDRSASNNVAFVVIDPRLAGKTVTTAANHYSLTRWLDTNAGTALLRNAATAANLKSAFGI